MSDRENDKTVIVTEGSSGGSGAIIAVVVLVLLVIGGLMYFGLPGTNDSGGEANINVDVPTPTNNSSQ